MNQLHSGLWLSDGSFSLLYVFVLHSAFSVTFLPFVHGIPLPLFSPSSRQSFSISTVYALCVLWLVISKSLCASSNVGFAPRILFPQAGSLDFDNPFSPHHYEMAFIQNFAHGRIQDQGYLARGSLAEPGRQINPRRGMTR